VDEKNVSTIIADSNYGRIQGRSQNGISVFRGIPFAKPPIGPLRFRAPQAPDSWKGVRPATGFGPGCVQGVNPFQEVIPINVPYTSEDCLYLNVWTPSLEGSRPVMVWIHGGGFVVGAGSEDVYAQGSEILARRGDVVLVTLNYRLGALGFLHGKTLCGEKLDSSGNEGVLDQLAALRWVQENISSFGGDPSNVTIFGQSAGAICVSAILGMPSAKGLYHRAIMESSGTASQLITPEQASLVTVAILKAAGLTADKASKLREISATDLAGMGMTAILAGGFFPVIDGEMLPRSTYDAIRDGETRGVPIIIGTTVDEQKLFDILDPSIASLDEAGLLTRAEGMAPGHGQSAADLYRNARRSRGESVTPPDLYSAMQTDKEYRYPTMRLGELQAQLTPDTYAYLFTWNKSPVMGGALGAFHGIDVPFQFRLDDNWFCPEARAGAETLSRKIQDAWLAFARTGNPSHTNLPSWIPYDANRRATMILDEICQVQDAPREQERSFWQSLAES